MLSEPDYGQVSVPLVTSFGKESESARWFVGFVLRKILSNLHGWISESSVLENTAQLLVTVMSNKSRYRIFNPSNCVQKMFYNVG